MKHLGQYLLMSVLVAHVQVPRLDAIIPKLCARGVNSKGWYEAAGRKVGIPVFLTACANPHPPIHHPPDAFQSLVASCKGILPGALSDKCPSALCVLMKR